MPHAVTLTKLSPYTSLQIKSSTSGFCYVVVLRSSKSWTASVFQSFYMLLQSILIGNFFQIGSADYLILNFPYHLLNSKSELLTFARWRHFDKFDELQINRCVQNIFLPHLKIFTLPGDILKHKVPFSTTCCISGSILYTDTAPTLILHLHHLSLSSRGELLSCTCMLYRPIEWMFHRPNCSCQ